MTSAQHRESANINASLMVLKSCLRVIAERKQDGQSKAKVPFRESRLTHLLQDCFLTSPDCLPRSSSTRGVQEGGVEAAAGGVRHDLIIVATISPCARDAIHTRNTLNHVCDLGEMR